MLNPESHKPIALVTGATGQIGAATVLSLADSSRAIVIHFHGNSTQADRLVKDVSCTGVQAIALQADLRSEHETNKMFNTIEEQIGTVTVMICTVGDILYGALEDYQSAEWLSLFNSNVMTVVNCCRRALPGMIEAEFGRIVTFGYAGVERLQSKQQILPYAVSKTGVLLITRSIAHQYARYNISANMIAPGIIGHSFPEAGNNLQVRIPAGRTGTPEEIANAVAFLVSESAGYISGSIIPVSGGFQI